MNEIQHGPAKDREQSQRGAAGQSDSSINVSHEEPPFRVPAMTAIAGMLVKHWAEG